MSLLESPIEGRGLSLRANAVAKRYGKVTALTSTDFAVGPGEFVGLVGENGAGKSTLAKLVTGATAPSEGTIEIDGRVRTLRSPHEALRNGVALIPQELALVPQLTVAENILLNHLPRRFGVVSRRTVLRDAEALMSRFGLFVDPARRVAAIPLADRQVVEILKALGRNSRMLVLDEPTAALGEDDSHKLFTVLEELRRSSTVSIVVISHNLQEIHRYADRIDVFRNGRRVLSDSPRTAPVKCFIAAMVGERDEDASAVALIRPAARSGDSAIEVSDLRTSGVNGLRGAHVRAARGEVVGVFGIRGSGIEELAAVLGGRHGGCSGTTRLDGQPTTLPRSPRAARRLGIGYVPADRKTEGLVLRLSVERAIGVMVRRSLSRWGVVISARAERELAATWMARFSVRASSSRQPVGELSGGNQQKVLLASRLATGCAVLVVSEPTRGVDIHARQEIHEQLIAHARRGFAVLVLTSDAEEAINVSDRLLVMQDGTVCAELSGTEMTRDRAILIAGRKQSVQ